MQIHTLIKAPLLATFVTSLLVCTGAAQAAYIYSGSNGTIVEDFDAMPTIAQAGVFSATVGVQAGISGTQFVGTKIAGTGGSATALNADTGSGNGGGLYSYGASGAPERALGSIASGSNIMGFGFELQNSSAVVITQLSVSLTLEVWRSSTSAVNVTNASFATTDSGATASNFLTATTGFTDVDPLDLVGPAPVTTNGALNGDDPANQTAISFVFTGLDIGPGESFFLRWQDIDNAGSDAGLAIDGLNIGVNIPEPGAFAALLGGAGFLGLIRRKR
jgi:hypothetical protein